MSLRKWDGQDLGGWIGHAGERKIQSHDIVKFPVWKTVKMVVL